MKLNAETIKVAPHFLLIGQFLGLAGSSGPSKVTFYLLMKQVLKFWVEVYLMSTHEIRIFGFFILPRLLGSMNTIYAIGRSLAFKVLRRVWLLSGRTVAANHVDFYSQVEL